MYMKILIVNNINVLHFTCFPPMSHKKEILPSNFHKVTLRKKYPGKITCWIIFMLLKICRSHWTSLAQFKNVGLTHFYFSDKRKKGLGQNVQHRPVLEFNIRHTYLQCRKCPAWPKKFLRTLSFSANIINGKFRIIHIIILIMALFILCHYPC